MSDTFKDRHAKLGCMVLKLFPKVMQMILNEFITPRGLQRLYLKQTFTFVYAENESCLMKKLPNMDEFTIELCYKILRFGNVLDEPKCKWGNVPKDTDVEIADDIQRLINATNSIISINSEEVTDSYSDNLLEEIKLMVRRIDSFLYNHALESIYNSLCIPVTDSTSILQDLSMVKAINIEENQPDTKNEIERYSRLSMAIIETFTDILRDVIRSAISAQELYKRCVPYIKQFYPEEQANLKALQNSNEFSSLGIPLMYKLLRQLSLIQSPTKGWGVTPDKEHTTLGDDIERIRCYRNQISHRSDTRIKENVFDEYFDKFQDIGRRMDIHFFKKTNYEQRIILQKTRGIDTEMMRKYENAMKDMENIKLKFEKRPIKFYWGECFDRCIKNLRCLLKDEKDEGREKVRVQIIFQNEDDTGRTIDILNSLKEEINEGLSGIEFIDATKGSVILIVDIQLEMMETDEILQTTLALFMKKILKCIPTSTNETFDMVLFPVEEYTQWNTSKTIGEPVYLDFEIEATLFETDDKMEEQLTKISEALSKHSNRIIDTNNNITATLLPISLEKTFAPMEVVSSGNEDTPNDRETDISIKSYLSTGVMTVKEADKDRPETYKDKTFAPKEVISCENADTQNAREMTISIKNNLRTNVLTFKEAHNDGHIPGKDGCVIRTEFITSKNADKDEQKTAKGSLLRASCIECDGHVIDCGVSRDLMDAYDAYKISTKDNNTTAKAFQKIMLLHGEEAIHMDLIVIAEFEKSILADESLICRYILGHFPNIFNDMYKLQEGLRLAMEKRKSNCAKAIAWEICRRFASKVIITQFYDIWPGFECGCSTPNSSKNVLFCSNNVVIVAEVSKINIISPKMKTFYDIPIVYKEVNGHSKEAMSLMEEADRTVDARKPFETSQDVSAEKVTEYFTKHSKLTMISKSHLKSKRFGKANQKFERVPCIQLFCRAKGIIPIGESHFSKQVGSIQTDIFEGYPILQARPLTIGTEFFVPTEKQNNCVEGQNAVGRPSNEDEEMDTGNDMNDVIKSFKGKAGTIGGFLKFNGEDAFLTCAHVVLSLDFLVSHPFGSAFHENPVKIYCKDQTGFRGVIPCGYLENFTFPPNEFYGSSMDAAIIKIDPNHARIHIDDAENRELKSNYLHKCCLDWQEVGAHTDFEVRTFGAVSLDQHIKDKATIIDEKNVEFETLYQAVANVYRDINPANVPNNIHFAVQAVDIVSKRLSDHPKNVIFLNQIAMHKIKFEQGDSGMCIYVRHNDRKLWCIGMAIATHPAGGCIITPLKAILRHFHY